MTGTRTRQPPRIATPLLSAPASPYQETAEDGYEYDDGCLNLGAETPIITPAISRESSWLKTGDPFAIASSKATAAVGGSGSLKRSSTSSMFPVKPTTSIYGGKPVAKPQRDIVWDATCGICFETAVSPHRTACCGNIFCDEHLSDWMERDSHCPTCRVLISDRVHSPPRSPLYASHQSDAPTTTIVSEKSENPHLTYPSIPTIDAESFALVSRVASILFLALVYYVLLA